MKKFSLLLTITSFILIIVTAVVNILITVQAFHSAGKNFWDMITTNQTGVFFTIWGENPLGAAGVMVLSFFTFATIIAARSTAK